MGVNKKLARRYNGNTTLIPQHLIPLVESMERRTFKESGVVWRRPAQMHTETLAGFRCVAALRRGR